MAINSIDTEFVLISAALVLLMTPGLAFFYGGLARSKDVVNTMKSTSFARRIGVFSSRNAIWYSHNLNV